MTSIALTFMKERFLQVTAHRNAGRWDEARAALGEIAAHLDDLEPLHRIDAGTWHTVHSHIVEAHRCATTHQEEPELRHVTRARYALERLPLHELDANTVEGARIEFLHAELSWRELYLAVRCRFGDRRPDLVARRDELFRGMLARGRTLALHRLENDERFQRTPYWLRTLFTRGNLLLFSVFLEDDPRLLEEPATLMTIVENLVREAGAPETWLEPLFDEPAFLCSYRESTQDATRKLLEHPAAQDLKAWFEMLWSSGVTAERYYQIAAAIRRATCSGVLHCLPLLARMEAASRPEERTRARAAVFEKLAERVYVPQLEALFKLAVARDDRIPPNLGQLVDQLRGKWRRLGGGPSLVLDDDAVVIRNSEAHGHTQYEPGDGATFISKSSRRRTELGPLCDEALERRLDAFLDRIRVIHLAACYLHHPDGPPVTSTAA